jgi:hypothetical protein
MPLPHNSHFDNRERHERIMHIASKVILIIGVIVFIGSIVSMGLGVGNIIDLGEENIYLDERSSGTFTIDDNESWDIEVYIIHPVDCESVDLTIVDSSGDDVIEYYYGCYYDEYDYSEGERELFASMSHEMSGMEYTLNSNAAVDISGTYCDETCEEEALSGGFAIAGGFGGICCSVLILILGIIMAFTLDDTKTHTVMQVGQMPVGQVAYQAPVQGQAPVAQSMYQAPVQANQPVAVPVTPITPPLVQQPPVEQATQPASVPVTPITPPTTQQPEQSAWWGDEPQQ